MTQEHPFKGAGGTEGGCGLFTVGFGLAAVSLYFFFDSVRVTTDAMGMMSGLARSAMHHAGIGGMGGNMHDMMQTTSMGILFVPFFLGVVLLFYNHRLWFAQGLTVIGLAILVIEIMSRIRFFMSMKTSHLLIMVVAFAAGCGLMLRSFREEKATPPAPEQE